EIRQLILRQKANGKTIVLASHLLNEVEKVCTDVVIIKKGNVLKSGRVDELLSNGKRVELGAVDIAALRNALVGMPGIGEVQERNGFLVAELDEAHDSAYVNKALLEKGIVLQHLVLVKSDLESEFLKLVQQ
ncbi:MAG: hypothetical protein RLZZ543_1087, partial [Bacteroidota bacterium]